MSIPNQAPDSSVTGFLQPMSTPDGQVPPGQPLENYLQQFVAGIAGMDGTMVRPRWQPEPANLPDWGVDWCAVGVMRRTPIGVYAWVQHFCDNEFNGPGHSEAQRHEELEVLATFYGPNCDAYCTNLQNGLMIWQNWSALRLVGLAFVEAQTPAHAPELIRERWWDRYDLTLIFRRIVRRNYPVLNILSADVLLHLDGTKQQPYDILVTVSNAAPATQGTDESDPPHNPE